MDIKLSTESPSPRKNIPDTADLPENITGIGDLTGMNFLNFFCNKTTKKENGQLTGNYPASGARNKGRDV